MTEKLHDAAPLVPTTDTGFQPRVMGSPPVAADLIQRCLAGAERAAFFQVFLGSLDFLLQICLQHHSSMNHAGVIGQRQKRQTT